MSNALAIATVTEALRNLITQHLDGAQVGGASVSTVSPDHPRRGIANPGVNVFLYQISPNAALRNQDLPTRAANGDLLRKPQVALDLHYLLTFYGDENALEPQRLLGATTLALHSFPTLPVELIESTESSTAFLRDSTLHTQIEQVRFTPVAFTLEELSKLWSFLLKVEYVLSTAYVASVVLIEADLATRPPALPVLTRKLQVQPMRQPTILDVVAASDPRAPITASADIILKGLNLTASSGAGTQVLISGKSQTPAAITPTSVTVALPSGLAAGPQTAQVVQSANLGVPPVPHAGTGVASSIATFVLSPDFAQLSPPGSAPIKFDSQYGSPPGPAVIVTLVPAVQKGQRVVLQLLSASSAPPSGRLFDGGTVENSTDTIAIPVAGVTSGTYVVRVLVDGAETPLITSYGGVPVGPTVTV